MLFIQCTKKLINELKISAEKPDLELADPLFSWHANLFLHNRRKCILVMNNLTRYNFLLYGLKSKDFSVFSKIVIDNIQENLLADGFKQDVVARYIGKCEETYFKTTSERSINSQISEMIRYSHLLLDKNDPKNEMVLNDINRQLNRFVMLTLPQIYSVKAMQEAFQDL